MRNIILIFTAIILLSGCHPYRIDIIQGNLIDDKMRSQLHLGMSKTQVDSLLGTPVLTDTFNPNTWIYAYTKQINGGKIEKRNLVLEFKNNRLIQIK
ncbi:MAG: outer membrane protein assembly factor BamE [Gammaproteobacteria bacterium]|nr:outer membrane protein assembly factor BamE [Gammaproteobacteria bacterium]